VTRQASALAACFLAAVLAVNVPLFLCLGLTSDASQWDLCTRTVLHGGVLYRDALENNLPGMLWLHALVRSVCGWRPEVLRAADLLVLGAVVWLLVRRLPSRGLAPRLALAGVLLLFYFSTAEWCHCQRDPWLLLPALLALGLRQRQVLLTVGRISNPSGPHGRFEKPSYRAKHLAGAFLEGVLWGAAFWLKPFVAVPALACWAVSVLGVRALSRSEHGKPVGVTAVLADGGALLAGGLTAGAAGVAWLWASGTWPAFADVVFGWNREYVVHRMVAIDLPTLLLGLVVRLFPWVLVHVAAGPLALLHVRRLLSGSLAAPPAETVGTALLSALYLGWLVQAVCLQQLFDYVHVPAVLLGLTVLAVSAVAIADCKLQIANLSVQSAICHLPSAMAKPVPLVRGRLVAAFFLLCVLLGYGPVLRARLPLWPRCVAEGSTPELRDRLMLLKNMSWSDLDRVRDYLRKRGVRDGELTCYSAPTIPLYLDLDVRPSTRHFLLQHVLAMFPRHRDLVLHELTSSGQRFLVCDLLWYGLNAREEDLEAAADALVPPLPRRWHEPYPWSERIVFRSGRYVVLEASAAEMPLWLQTVPEP
jgi:hypothetical protein